MTVNSRDLIKYRSRCLTPAFILDYFRQQGIDPDSLLRGTGLTKAFIENPNNWVSLVKLQRLLQNCYAAVSDLTLYDWKKIALQLRQGVAGNFFNGVTSMVGTHSLFMMAPRYIKSSCNYQQLELLFIGNGTADFLTYLEADVVPLTSGYRFQLMAGILAAVSFADGMKLAEADVLIDQSPLRNIVKKMYRRYGFSYRQRENTVYIDNKAIGCKIRLEEDIINGRKVFSNRYVCKPPFNAVLIKEDLKDGDNVLLRRGDIFDAPYGRIRVKWDTRCAEPALQKGLAEDTQLARNTFLFLEDQIKLTEERFFESEKLREKEKRISKKLKLANLDLKEEIVERRRAEMLLKAREKEMELQTANMQETNTALKVLLKKREEDKKIFSEKVLFNIKELIIPYLEKLKETDLKATQRAYVEILESNFEELSNPLALKLSLKYFNLTRAEIRVAILIKQGRTTQQIADLLHLSPRTIDAYRANIRRKLKIKNKKINLCTYLNSI